MNSITYKDIFKQLIQSKSINSLSEFDSLFDKIKDNAIKMANLSGLEKVDEYTLKSYLLL